MSQERTDGRQGRHVATMPAGQRRRVVWAAALFLMAGIAFALVVLALALH